MSLFTADSPVLKVEGLETKFDSALVSNSLVILLGGNHLAARILQQLHYCSHAGYGVVIDGVRWIYKPIREFVSEMLVGFTSWQIRQAIAFLVEIGVIRKEHLYAAHHGHNYAPKNRTLYYSVVYERLAELVREFFKKNKKAETEESSCFVRSTNMNCASYEKVICVPNKTYTNKTSIQNNQRKQEKNPSPTPPVDSPKKSKQSPKLKIRTRPKTQSEIPIQNTNAHSGGGSSSSTFSNSKPINQEKGTQPKVDLSKVIARPQKPNVGHKAVEVEANSARVDEKINKENVCTVKQAVQEFVQTLDVDVQVVQESVHQVAVVPEPVQEPVVEESPSDPVESPPEPLPKTERPKTPRGTKPRPRVYENALWESPEQRIRFKKDCAVAVAKGVGNARNNMALVAFVVHQIDLGHSHIYFEEWKAGIPIGTSERQEWEAAPNKPYSKFVEYLAEKLKREEDSREMALLKVVKLLKDKLQAGIFWRDFKRVIEGLRQDYEKAVANGLPVALPVWFIDRADVSVERAGESAMVLARLAPEQIDWINKGLPESEKLLSGTGNLSLPGAEPPQVVEEQELTASADLWTDEEDEDFCFNGFIDFAYLEHQAKKVAANPNQLSLLLIDFKSAMRQGTKKQREKIRQMITSIYPELLDFL